MWVRVTCPNGHKVKIETKYLGRSNRCPRCQAHVYLWIQVTCSNGHTLRVQSKFAGRTGRCPECGEGVEVPDLTEVIAMETLGDSLLDDGDENVLNEPQEALVDVSKLGMGSDVERSDEPPVPSRECPHCKSKINKSFRTCPVCQKYIGDAGAAEAAASSKVSSAGKSVNCSNCGVTSYPGDEFCSNCGAPLG